MGKELPKYHKKIGGYVVTKKSDQTIVSNNGKNGGLLKGRKHYDKKGKAIGGIKAIVTDIDKEIEVESGEAIIKESALKDKTVKTLTGTNAQILNLINTRAGGNPIYAPSEVKMAKGGLIGDDCFSMPKNTDEERRAYAECILKGLDYRYSSNSHTDYGHSMYFKVGDIKVRFSDHSVTNRERMNEEAHFNWHGKKPMVEQSLLRLKYLLGDENVVYKKIKLEMPSGNIRDVFGFEYVNEMAKGGSIEDNCISFIKNSEAIKNNGYFHYFKNISIYADFGTKVPKTKSFYLCAYNSGGQKNLKVTDTLNLDLINKLQEIIDCEKSICRIIVDEFFRKAKRIESNDLSRMTGENIIVVDRYNIVCDNIKNEFSSGGSITPSAINNMTKAEQKAFYKTKEGKELDKQTYTKWKSLVNMSKGELESFYNSKEGKEAGLSASEAKAEGIDSGRESARWIMKMKDIPYTEWTSNMWVWAKKQISFVSRMKGMRGDLYDDKGNKTRKHLALLIWGHNPKKMAEGGVIPQQGTLFTKDKKNKLDYKKVGNDYVFKVYDVESNPVENYTRHQYKKRNNNEATMDYNQFINYLYSEHYIDDKKMAEGGNVGDSNLLAPNGKPSNLTAEQYKLVRTAAFKKWFGDWENDAENASKVVDENGEPLIVYHGSRQVNENTKFDIFNIGNGAYGKGVYFTSDKKEAIGWALGNYVYEVFLNVKNPFVENNYRKWFPHKTESSDFDGIIQMDLQEVSMVITFNSNQIKLADGTNTTFDGSNADIRFAEGGVTGDVFSIKDPEQFKQLITLYNKFSEKFDVDNYFVDDSSVVFLRKVKFTDAELKGMAQYIADLSKNQNFSIISNKKPEISNGYFKFFLKERVRYREGGNVEDEVITYRNKFNKKYGFELNESHSLQQIAKLTGLKLSALQDIYNKGIGAYKTNPSSVRPNVKSKEQWAMARVYSAVMGGKASKVDENELERGKMAEGGSVGAGGFLKIDNKDTFYHASNTKRSGRLKPSTAQQFGTGVYFTTSKDLATFEFGEEVTEAKLALDNPVYTNTKEWGKVEELALQKANEGKPKDEDGYIIGEETDFYEIKANFISDAAKELGYDAIIDENSSQYENEIVVLDESKIKYPEDLEQSIKETPQAGSVGEITFTDYKGEQIMYEPHNREYFVISNDENIFKSLEDAKAFIDNPKSVIQTEYAKMVRGEMDGEIRFAEGGSVGDNFYNNKDMSNQQEMQVQFDLIKAELDKQKYKNKSVISFAKEKIEEMLKENPSAYPFYVEKYLDLPKSVRDSLNPFSEEFDGSASPVMKWLKEQDKNVFDVLKVEEYSLPKTKVIQTNPDDKNFMDIHSDFVNYDNTARTIMMATHFNENGIVSTDAHKMLITPYRGNSKKLEGNFCHTKKCIEYYKSKKITSDDRFPAWKQVIPLSNIEYEMNAAAVYDFIKNAIKYELMNTVTNKLVFKYGEEKIAFNANFMLTCIQGMSELGHKELSIAISTPSRAALIIPKGRLEDANNLKTDFALLMPVMLSNYSWEDDMTYFGKFNLETSCYIDPNELTYCFDAEKVKGIKGDSVSQLKKGIKVEKEHEKTFKKVAKGKISVKDAIKETAEEHIAENPNYYDELELVDGEKKKEKFGDINVSRHKEGSKIAIRVYDTNTNELMILFYPSFLYPKKLTNKMAAEQMMKNKMTKQEKEYYEKKKNGTKFKEIPLPSESEDEIDLELLMKEAEINVAKSKKGKKPTQKDIDEEFHRLLMEK